ncbi:MAG: ATP-binding protein [Acidobacteriota bacterium]
MSSPERNEIELTFGSDIAFLDLVQEISDSVSRKAGFSADDLYWIGLSVREAVTNAIQHGNRQDPDKRVRVSFRLGTDRISIIVRDQGQGIRESDIPDPLDPENLLKPRGRGIFFVRSFMDNVRFRVCPEGGHEVIMEKLRGTKNQGEENENRNSNRE